MSFHNSKHAECWLFSAAEINKCRAVANNRSNGVKDASTIYTTIKDGNTFGEVKLEDDVLVAHEQQLYEEEMILRHFCRQIQISLSIEERRTLGFAARDQKHWRVSATAIMYFRRFYLNNSLSIHDPRVILLGCIVLASKIEESRILRLSDLLQLNPKTNEAKVLKAELSVIQSLNFHTQIFHPQNLCHTLIADIKRKYGIKTYKNTVKEHEEIESITAESSTDDIEVKKLAMQPHIFDTWILASDQVLETLQLTNVSLIYSPLQIAYAALSITESSVVSKTIQLQSLETKEISIISTYFIKQFGKEQSEFYQKNVKDVVVLLGDGQNCREEKEIDLVRNALMNVKLRAIWNTGTVPLTGIKKEISTNGPAKKKMKK